MRWAGPGDGGGDGEERTDFKESLKLGCVGWMCQ